jgi:osmotically-inducible protein OsmY
MGFRFVTTNRKGLLVSINSTVEDAVRDSLVHDPRIPDPSEVAVVTVDGTAILRGTVGSFSQRRAAGDDARRVEGIDDVDNQLQVRLLDGSRREDADIRGIALQVLMWDTEVPDGVIDVEVRDGWVTLKGEVTHQFESDTAYDDMANLHGVVGITNEIRVATVLSPNRDAPSARRPT